MSRLPKILFATFITLFTVSLWASTEGAPKAKTHVISSTGFNDLLGRQIVAGTFVTESESNGSFLLKNNLVPSTSNQLNHPIFYQKYYNSFLLFLADEDTMRPMRSADIPYF